MSKRLGGIIGCKYKTSSWHLNGFPYGCNLGSKAPRSTGHRCEGPQIYSCSAVCMYVCINVYLVFIKLHITA